MRANRPMSRLFFVISIVLHSLTQCAAVARIGATSGNGSFLVGPKRNNGRHVKYTIDDLMNGQFEYKVSDDIDMDPCKSSTYRHRERSGEPTAA